MANTTFSVCAAIGSAAVAALAAVAGVWVVTGIWAALALGFIARASERWWRGGG